MPLFSFEKRDIYLTLGANFLVEYLVSSNPSLLLSFSLIAHFSTEQFVVMSALLQNMSLLY